jgi:acetyl-CoA synthetase
VPELSHSLGCFAGFSASAVAARINDSECKMVITSDGGYRGTKRLI